MYKLVAIDLDGTLLNNEHTVSNETKIAISKLVMTDTKVVFASGRATSGILHILEKLEITNQLEYIICFNGSKTINIKTNEILDQNILQGSDLKHIHQLAKDNNCFCYAYNNTDIFTDNMNEYIELEAIKNKLVPQKKDFSLIPNDTDILKIIIADTTEKLDQLEKRIPLEIKQKYSVVRSHYNNLEFLSPSANKAIALENLSNKLGIHLDEVIAIGDAGNDINMIKLAGLGIAMGNAFDNVKEVADYITDTNDNNGVAKVIEKFILH